MSEPAPPFGKGKTTVKAFNCRSCGGRVQLRATGISVTAVCEHCHCVIDAADPDLKVIQRAEAAYVKSDLPIGIRGELFGVSWEIIGYVRKAVAGTIYRWDEYLLFNPWHGFRFLSKSSHHWTFFKRLNEHVQGIGPNRVTAQGRSFSLFNRDIARVEAVKGEFYWRIKVGDESHTSDYINPPFMLSKDETMDETNVSLGVYVPHKDIAKAFGARISSPLSVGACQPAPFERSVSKIMNVAALSFTAAIIIQAVSMIVLPHHQILNISDTSIMPAVPEVSDTGTGSWSDNISAPEVRGETLSTELFELKSPGAVRISSEAVLDNAWAELSLSMVNEKTGHVYAIRQGLEHYYGVSDGERWSEGSNKAESFLSRVPAGTYRLLIDADSDLLAKSKKLSFTLKLEHGVTDWSNLLMSLLMIGFFPAYVIARRFSFESARWSDSSYSPSGALKEDEE
jgi:hypothetical protein